MGSGEERRRRQSVARVLAGELEKGGRRPRSQPPLGTQVGGPLRPGRRGMDRRSLPGPPSGWPGDPPPAHGRSLGAGGGAHCLGAVQARPGAPRGLDHRPHLRRAGVPNRRARHRSCPRALPTPQGPLLLRPSACQDELSLGSECHFAHLARVKLSERLVEGCHCLRIQIVGGFSRRQGHRLVEHQPSVGKLIDDELR